MAIFRSEEKLIVAAHFLGNHSMRGNSKVRPKLDVIQDLLHVEAHD